MILELPIMDMPDWLQRAAIPLGTLPLHDMLVSSVYYPASGFDGSPVEFLAGNFFSFVYVDYGVNRQSLLEQLSRFRGYRPLAWRDVTPQEFALQRWYLLPSFNPRSRQLQQEPPQGWHVHPLKPEDGNPHRTTNLIAQPFGLWAILEPTPAHGPARVPERFSLLQIVAEGVAVFGELYHGNNVAPGVVAIIQPGHGCGGNWTDFTDPNQVLARLVLNNPAGAPEYLLYGGWGNPDSYDAACWHQQYTTLVSRLSPNLGLWSREPYPED